KHFEQGFLHYRYGVSGPSFVRNVPPLAIPWSWESSSPRSDGSKGFLRLVSAADGSIYLGACNWIDGRVHVYRWDQGRFRLQVQRRSPLIGMVCLDGAFLCLFAFALPMLLWAGWAWLIERRHPRRLYSAGLQTVELATASRRGFARLIDLAVVL